VGDRLSINRYDHRIAAVQQSILGRGKAWSNGPRAWSGWPHFELISERRISGLITIRADDSRAIVEGHHISLARYSVPVKAILENVEPEFSNVANTALGATIDRRDRNPWGLRKNLFPRE
jgi:hypothetical protein